jgi:16S rRNA (cytosine967-C5)-methyltransferase
MQLIARAARRLGLETIRVLERDSTRILDDLSTREDSETIEAGGPRFDRVLVDAPCSGLGTLRRNSDARWRVKPETPALLATLQGSLLERGSEVLRRGGCLVYSTCTLTREENEQVVANFIGHHPNFRIVERDELPDELAPLVGDDGFLRCHPHRHDADGFFAVRLERTE